MASLALAMSPASADTPGPAVPGSSGAAIAASTPFATDAPGMKVGTQTFPGTGPIHELPAFPTVGGFSCEVAVANDGDLITDEFVGNKMGRVDPHTGEVSEIPLPNLAGLPGGQNRGPDGDIWFGEVGGNALGRLDTETETITTYPFPWANVSVTTGLPFPAAINVGPGVSFDTTWAKDGKIYFTAIGLNAIGSYDPATQQWEKFTIPTPLSGPVAMEEGPNDTVAITEGITNKVALFDVDTHQWKEYPIPTLGLGTTFPAGLTVSPDDRYLYFGETLAGKVGRLDSVTGQIKEYDLNALRAGGLLGGLLNLNGNPLPEPGQLRFGSDGKLYIVNGTFTGGGTIGQLDVATSEYHEISTPTPVSMPCDLNNTVPGKIIFASFLSNRVSYIDIPNTTDISNTYPRFG
jgi:virginiamycin B lyase